MRRVVLNVFFFFLCVSGVSAQTIPSALERQFTTVASQIETLRQQVRNPDSSANPVQTEEQLRKLLAEVEAIQSAARAEQMKIAEQLAALPSLPAEEGERDANVERQRQDLQGGREIQSAILTRATRQQADINRLLTLLAETRRLSKLQTDVELRRAALEDVAATLLDESEAPDLLGLREQVRIIRDAADETIITLEQSRAVVEADLERLGPAPAEGETEAPEIARSRERLSALLVQEDSIIRQAKLNLAEAGRLLDDIAASRRDQFYDQIFERGPSLLQPSIWATAASDAVKEAQLSGQFFRSWVSEQKAEGTLARSLVGLAIGAVVGILLFGPLRRWANQRILRKLEELEPTSGRRAVAALVRILSRTVPVIIAGGILYAVLSEIGLISQVARGFAGQVWLAFVALIVTEASTSAVFSPRTAGWRLVPLKSGSATKVRLLLVTVVAVFFLDRVLASGAPLLGGTQDVAYVQSAIAAVLLGFCLLILSRQSLWSLREERAESVRKDTKSFLGYIRLSVRLISVAIILSAIIGLVALAHYAATRMVMVFGFVAFGLLIRLLSQEAVQAFAARYVVPVDQSEALNEGEREEPVLFYWIGVLVDLAIITLLLPPIALAVGAEWSDVSEVVRQAFFGFEVGSVRISVSDILVAIGAFFVILFITRFVQKTAEERFLPRTRLDEGVKSSLKTLIGYVGLVIAALSAVGLIGFKLSSLAIVAGALSVGIGFGLQSIVNNFVSGLILLFERPIKVGDWIVTSSGEGIVKRISVRSTEIETFDRSSVIVPNSELISGSVTNWTHKNKMGRVIIAVGISYSDNPRQVVKLLEEVAAESKVLMKNPAPFVYFDDFGDSSLNLQLRGFIRDVGGGLGARTELRLAIWEKFQEHGIEIPFPQRDLHVRSGLPQITTEVAAAPAPETAPPDRAAAE